MPAPTNTSALTATDIGSNLPYSVQQTVDDAGTTYTVWYSYTAQPGDGVIGVWGFGDLSVYKPTIWLYEGPASAPTGYPSGAQIVLENKPILFPVTAGTLYLFKFVSNAGNPTPAVLTLSVLQAPEAEIPAGSIIVPDLSSPFPAAALSSTNGAILQFIIPFAAGESGDILTNGRSLVTDNFVDTDLKLYDTDFALTAEVAVETTDANPGVVRTHIPTQKWHALSQTTDPTKLYSVTSAGVLSAVLANPSVTAVVKGIGLSTDETILYYVINTAGTGIKRWNITTDLAMADLVAGTAGYLPKDLIVLGDETIIGLFYDTGGTTTVKALRYNTSGTLLNTYDMGTGNANEARLASAPDDPVSFWIWHQPQDPGVSIQSHFVHLTTSTGATITDFTVEEFSNGKYFGAASATPQRFGHSESCPFFISRVATGESSFSIETRTDPIRRVRQAPHLWDGANGHRLTYPGFQLLVESGAPRDTDIPLTFFLQWSDDGGHTWSNLHEIQGSPIGRYLYRFWWHRLGQSRDRVFRVVNSDDAKIVLVDALLTPDPREGAN